MSISTENQRRAELRRRAQRLLVLDAVFLYAPIGKPEVVDASGLSEPEVSAMLDVLADVGLVRWDGDLLERTGPMMLLKGQEHVALYEATDGAEGHEWAGAHALILTTKGGRSGRERKAPLIYGRRGDDYILVASKGGSPEDPSWYHNLIADPEAEIQVGGERITVRARDAEGDERAELWPIMTECWPAYDDYEQMVERTIPVVVLEPHRSTQLEDN